MKTASIVAALIATVAVAQAEVTPYISISGGYAIANDIDWDAGGGRKGTEKFDDGFTVEGAFGLGFGAFRAELAGGYQLNDFEDSGGDMALIIGMLNGYFDFHNDSPLTPYILAGIGVINAEVDSEDDTFMGGQVGAGVGYAISDSFILDLKYKYLMADDADFGGVDVEDIGGHQIQLGARFLF